MNDTRKWVALGSRVYGDGVPYATTYGAGTSGGNVCLAMDISKALNSARALPSLVEALEDCVSVLADPIVGTVHHDEPDWYIALDKAVAKARAALALAKGE